MNRASKAVAGAMGKRVLEEGTLELAQVTGLVGRLTSSDRDILLAAWDAPVDVESLGKPHTYPREVYTTSEILWLVFYKLLSVWVDGADRVWVRTTALGQECARPAGRPKRKRPSRRKEVVNGSA